MTRSNPTSYSVRILDAGACTTDVCARLANIHAGAFEAIGEAGWSAHSIESTASGLGVKVLVAFSSDTPLPLEDTVCAFALVRTVAAEAELLTIAVSPDQSGHGIGRMLMDACLSNARDDSAQSIFLEVRATNSAALALYHKLGFTQVGERLNYYTLVDGSRHHALVLRYNLE